MIRLILCVGVLQAVLQQVVSCLSGKIVAEERGLTVHFQTILSSSGTAAANKVWLLVAVRSRAGIWVQQQQYIQYKRQPCELNSTCCFFNQPSKYIRSRVLRRDYKNKTERRGGRRSLQEGKAGYLLVQSDRRETTAGIRGYSIHVGLEHVRFLE